MDITQGEELKQKLYSNNFTERIEARNALPNTNYEEECLIPLKENWLPYWFGSANAWIAFVGSSPGNSGDKIDISYPSFTTVNSHFRDFNDTQKFWETIRDYSKFMLSDHIGLKDDEWLKMVLAGNLISNHAGNSKDILHLLKHPETLNATVELLRLVKPKLIVCLETAVQQSLRKAFLASGFVENSISLKEQVLSGIKKPIIYKVNTSEFSSPDKEWCFILTKTPMHPSRRSLCDQTNIKNFLKEKLILSMHSN